MVVAGLAGEPLSGLDHKPPPQAETTRSVNGRIMMNPPTNSLTANCQPIKTTSTMPSSITRLVEATMNTDAATKSAPFTKSDFAIALATYEHEEEAIPYPEAPSDRGRAGDRPTSPAWLHGSRRPAPRRKA